MSAAFFLDFSRGVGLYMGLISVLTLVELVLPFRRRQGQGSRLAANLGLLFLFFAFNLMLGLASVGLTAEFHRRGLGLMPQLGLPFWVVFAAGFIALDFTSYVAHLLMHKVPIMWRVHAVHHSDAHVDATTSFRQHPLEGLWRFGFTLGPALVLGLPADVVAIYRLVSGVNAIFEHANISIGRTLDSALSLLLVTPNMHKVHHSRHQAETDSNYGNLFSLFDRLSRTFTPTDRAANIRYGLAEHDHPLSLARLLRLPFERRNSAPKA